MKRWIVAALAILAPAALAANGIDWIDNGGSVKNQLGSRECVRFQFISTDTDESRHLDVRNKCITFQFEPDLTGSATTAKVDLYGCNTEDADADGTQDTTACSALYIVDTDLDGIPDSNQLDGTTAGRRGMLGCIRIAGTIYADPNPVPGAGDTAELRVCSHDS